MRPLYIFDLDGTLALIDHRVPLVKCESPDWDAFYEACDKDAPNRAVLLTLNALLAFADVWVFSGRSDQVRGKTLNWLRKWTALDENQLETGLMMRRAGDYTRDEELKRSWLKGMLDVDRERLVAVFEDRDRMVQMWRSEGVPCFQVAPGEF